MIQVKDISKTYKVIKRQAGFKNAVKSFFSHKYETVNALNNISFTINDGEMVGYIGPNGAGKSTTIKIMCGVLTPDSGECVINGRVPYKDRIAHVKDIGVVFGQRSQLWWDIPVIDSYELIKQIYKIDESLYRKNVNELTELLDLKELLKTPVRNLSLGQRMRCEIASSLLHNPKVLFLDEPTIGLDAVSKIAVRKFIKNINSERKTTIILTTHDMQDIESLTERVLLIGKGKILLDGNFLDLKKKASNRKTLLVQYKGDAPELHESMILNSSKEGKLVVTFNSSALSVSDAITYLASRTELLDVSVSDISSEEVVAELYKEYNI